MNKKEKERLQEAIEQSVASKKCVVFPQYDEGYLIRAHYNQYKIDTVYWKDKDGNIYRVFMEIRQVGMHGIPGLFVVGTFSIDNFSSGNLSMIRSENRYFPEEDDQWEEMCTKEKARRATKVRTWIIDENGIARCPHCNASTIEDEYTGKPILFKYCPECGKFLNGHR